MNPLSTLSRPLRPTLDKPSSPLLNLRGGSSSSSSSSSKKKKSGKKTKSKSSGGTKSKKKKPKKEEEDGGSSEEKLSEGKKAIGEAMERDAAESLGDAIR